MAHAAYISGARFKNHHDGRIHDYTKRQDVVHTEVMLPDGAPTWMKDPEHLWSAAERAERRKDGRPGRRATLSLPWQFSDEARLEAVRRFLQPIVRHDRLAVQFALHRPHDGEVEGRNHHAHLLMSARKITPEGFARKKTSLRYQNGKDWLRHQRAEWAAVLNEVSQRHGLGLVFDHRSREARHQEGNAASLPLNTYKAVQFGRVPLKAREVVTYFKTLEREVRATGLKGDQLRVYQSKIGQAQREALRHFHSALGKARAAPSLKDRTKAVRQKRQALEAVYKERARLRDQQRLLKAIGDQLEVQEAQENAALDRWARGLDQGMALAAERIERAKLQQHADALRVEHQTAVQDMAREQAHKALELEQMGRSHEAAAVRENAEMFRLGPTLKGNEAEKQAMRDIAKSRITHARELDQQRLPRNDDT